MTNLTWGVKGLKLNPLTPQSDYHVTSPLMHMKFSRKGIENT